MDPMDRLGHLDQTVHLVMMDRMDRLVVAVDLVLVDQMDRLVHLDLMGHLACKGQLSPLHMPSNRYQHHSHQMHKLGGVEEDGGVKVDEDQLLPNK